MIQAEDSMEPQQISKLEPVEKESVNKAVNQILEVDLQEGLRLVKKKVQSLEPEDLGTAYQRIKQTLENLQTGLQALILIQSEANFADAQRTLQHVIKTFDQLGHEELKDFATNQSVYYEAVHEYRKGNKYKAKELMQEVKQYLKKTSKFSKIFDMYIARMEPETLFMAAMQEMQELDYIRAKMFIEQASHSAKTVAEKYEETSHPEYCKFMALAFYFQALYKFKISLSYLSQFECDEILIECDKILTDEDFTSDGVQAKELFEQCATEEVDIIKQKHKITCLTLLLEVIVELATIIKSMLGSAFILNLEALTSIKQKISTASDSAAKAGEDGLVLIRICDQLTNQVKNVERLAKPSRTDFGVYSGLVASLLFLVLFLTTFWANSALGFGLEPSTLIKMCLGLGLIGGFGYGALKFKGFLQFSKGK